MPERPDYIDPWAAMRVSDFMEEARVGRWQLLPFDVDGEHIERSQVIAMAEADSQEELEMRLARSVPAGHYMSLRRRRTRAEYRAELDRIVSEDLSDEQIDKLRADVHSYVPVMSDTPAEIDGHQHAIVYGTGRVLVHGLGLGCLVSGLLAKPCDQCEGRGSWPYPMRQVCPACGATGKAVTHIDVVEVDPEVIALTGGYYTSDPRVTIHEGDCMTYEWPSDARWDYVWHDIWTYISERNLSPDEAEHGISYGMLFDRFAPHADLQGAWAWEEAQAAARVNATRRALEEAWADRFFAAPDEDKVELLVDRLIRDKLRSGMLGKLPDGEPVPDHVRAYMDDQLGLTEMCEKIVASGLDREKVITGWRAQQDRAEPLARPNEEE